MPLAAPVAVFSQISVIINAAAFSALGFTDGSKQFEGRVLMSIFGSSFIANLVILLFPGHCNAIGFTKQVMACSAQIALFFLSYQYSSQQKLKSFMFVVSIWLPAVILLALALHQQEETFHMSSHEVCSKDFTKTTTLWMGIEIFRMFISSMTLSLSILILAFNYRDLKTSSRSPRAQSLFRLFFIAIFDNAVLLVGGILNICFSITQLYNDIRAIAILYVIVFCHYVFTPVLFLMVYSRVLQHSRGKGKPKSFDDTPTIKVVDSRPYYGQPNSDAGSNNSLLRGN